MTAILTKLQTKLTKLTAQLKITRGNRAKAKIIIAILKVEAAIETLESIQEPLKRKSKEKVKDDFCKKTEKTTIKLFESRFKNAKVDITTNKITLKSGSAELSLNCAVTLDSDYYNHYNRVKIIKNLKASQTSKAHSVFHFVGSILKAC